LGATTFAGADFTGVAAFLAVPTAFTGAFWTGTGFTTF
jgi:hypothetical protein